MRLHPCRLGRRLIDRTAFSRNRRDAKRRLAVDRGYNPPAMLAQHFQAILHLHVGCVILSGTLFFARGLMRLRGRAVANHRALRMLSYAIDTTLLGAAVLLTLIIHQFPFANGWLTVKLGLLLLYIVLGSLALKRARTAHARLAAFVAALATYGLIVSVAMTQNPLGLLGLLAGF